MPSPEAARHESSVWLEAESAAGVTYRIARLSLKRRAALMREMAEALAELEFQDAGQDWRSRLRAGELRLRIEAAYVRWGLLEIRGLTIDGVAADAGSLIERGPEPLGREIARRIRAEAGLAPDELKN